MTALDILTSTGNLYLARDTPFSKVLSHMYVYVYALNYGVPVWVYTSLMLYLLAYD